MRVNRELGASCATLRLAKRFLDILSSDSYEFAASKQFAVVALVVACQALFYAQGSQQQGHKYCHAVCQREPSIRVELLSSWCRLTQASNQAIDLGSTGEFEGGQSASAALDQIQSIGSSGQEVCTRLIRVRLTGTGVRSH